MQNLRKTNETGRSMVEMLGVLAIIGVLSVTGVAGYKTAVRKALANKLLNQSSMRATDVATKIGSGNLEGLINDAFDNDLGGGVTMMPGVKGPDGYTDYDESDEQFTLMLEGLDEEMCQQMQSMAGGSRSVVRAVLCDGDKAILTFNKDLSANPVSSDFDGNKEGCENSGRKYCDNDTCIPSSEECPVTGPTCPTGSSTEGRGGSTGIKIDGVLCQCDDENAVYTSKGCEVRTGDTCDDHTTNQCGLGYYCQFSPKGCYDSDRGDGVCTAVESSIPIKDGLYLKSSDKTDWWSAYSWCKGNNMNLITSSIVGLPTNQWYEGWDDRVLYQYFDQEFVSWTGHKHEDSCQAWFVGATNIGDYETIYYNYRNGKYFVALCE